MTWDFWVAGLLWSVTASSEQPTSLSACSPSESRSLMYPSFDSLDRTTPSMIPSLYRPHHDSEHLAADPSLRKCELGHSYNASMPVLPPAGKAFLAVLITAFHDFTFASIAKSQLSKKIKGRPSIMLELPLNQVSF